MPTLPLAVRVLAILVGLVFVLAGGAKLTGQQVMVDQFNHFGYAPWFRYVVGIGETLFGIGLFVPRFIKWSAPALGAIMVGAVVTHFLHDPPSAAIPAAGLLLVLGYVYWRVGSLTGTANTDV